MKKISSIIVAALGFAFASTEALADQTLEKHFPNIPSVPTANLPTLGNVPTFYVNVSPNEMASLLREDQNEGRSHFDQTKPSLLDPYITKVVSSPVGSSSANGFSQGNSYICITIVTTYVPWYQGSANTAGVTSTNATRTCATAYSPLSRSDLTNLNKFYASYGVVPSTANGNMEPGKVAILRINPMPVENSQTMTNEGWGFALFDQPGSSGRLQEVVWTAAVYIMSGT